MFIGCLQCAPWVGIHPACALTRNLTCDLPLFRTTFQPTELHGPGQKVRTFYAWSSKSQPSFSTLWYCFGQLGPPTASWAGLTLNPGSCLLDWEACFLVPVTSISIYHRAEHMADKWMSKACTLSCCTPACLQVQTPTLQSTGKEKWLLFLATWPKVKVLEHYEHQPEGMVGRKSVIIQKLQFYFLPGPSICCRAKLGTWQGACLLSEEAKCPSKMSQWENGTREWVTWEERLKDLVCLKIF